MQGTLIQGFGLLMLALLLVELCQIGEALRCVRVVYPQLLLTDGECLLVQWFRLDILALVVVNFREIVEADRRRRMVSTLLLLTFVDS